MKRKAQVIAVSLALLLISLVAAQRTLAQQSHDHKSHGDWKTGMLRISEPVWAGDVRLKSGMYHVKNVMDGDKHVLVIKSVALPAGYKEFSMQEEKEVARLECRVEPVAKSTSNTKILLRKNATGESFIEEIQIAAEKVKHVLSSSAPQVTNGNY